MGRCGPQCEGWKPLDTWAFKGRCEPASDEDTIRSGLHSLKRGKNADVTRIGARCSTRRPSRGSFGETNYVEAFKQRKDSLDLG